MPIYEVEFQEDVIHCNECVNDVDKDIQGNCFVYYGHDESRCKYLQDIIYNKAIGEIHIVCNFRK